MARITLGRTGITAEQNAFGALPIQRVSFDMAGQLLNRSVSSESALSSDIKRANDLYKEQLASIKKIYDEYFGSYGSEKAHHTLHTSYVARKVNADHE